MKKKKITLAVVISALVIATVGGIIAYGLIAGSNSTDHSVSDSNQFEPPLHNTSNMEPSVVTNPNIPPIIPSDTERISQEFHPDLEFDVEDYKPQEKNPYVETVEIEYGIKEKERNE